VCIQIANVFAAVLRCLPETFDVFLLSTISHEYGTIDNTLEILKIINKGKLLDVIERFHIYKTNKVKQIMNEQYVDEHNVLFEILLRYDRTS
jgi:hypothetical protein